MLGSHHLIHSEYNGAELPSQKRLCATLPLLNTVHKTEPYAFSTSREWSHGELARPAMSFIPDVLLHGTSGEIELIHHTAPATMLQVRVLRLCHPQKLTLFIHANNHGSQGH
jgi:hypothetical protein